MNYRQLEVFRAVMDSGSATAAARLLSLSQPAVSQHLAQLEAELDLPLFIRERGRLVATGQADALYAEVALAFEGMERIVNLAGKMRSHSTGVLRIAAPYSFSEAFLPDLLAAFSASRKTLRYSVELGSYDSILGMVAKREVDLGIVKEPVDRPGISIHHLIDSEAVCMLPQGHPLTTRKRIALAQLAQEPLVLLGRQAPWRHEIHAVLRRHGLSPEVRIETHSVAAVCGFVSRGFGVAIVPELLGAQFCGRGIVLRPLASSIAHHFAIAYPKGGHQGVLVAEFAQTARRIAQALIRRGRQQASTSEF